MLPEAIAKNMADVIRTGGSSSSSSATRGGVFTLLYDTPEGKQEVGPPAGTDWVLPQQRGAPACVPLCLCAGPSMWPFLLLGCTLTIRLHGQSEASIVRDGRPAVVGKGSLPCGPQHDANPPKPNPKP